MLKLLVRLVGLLLRSHQVWALIQLQLSTGARSGELVRVRPIDLDMTG
ncbi:MAG: hypothetical protein IH830_05865 [Planctomycetes bacterium]|nr:hypothetical protein [Planctomycetota bacterium]